jgi:hypothetical protein
VEALKVPRPHQNDPAWQQTPVNLDDYANELQELRAHDVHRISRMVGMRDLVEQFRRDDPRTSTWDYGRRFLGTGPNGKHDIRLPYLLATMIKHTHRVASKVPDVRVDRADQSLAERWRQYALERYLAVCWARSDAAVQIQDGAWDGSGVGAVAFEVDYHIKDQIGCFYARAPEGIVIVPDPVTVWPFQRVYRSWTTSVAALKATYNGRDVSPFDSTFGPVAVEDLVPDEGGDKDTNRCTVHEVSTPEFKLRWCGSVELYYIEHNYGICPWVVVPNVGPRRKLYGYGDVEMLADAALYYQMLMSKQADVTAFAARGAYTEENTGQNAELISSIIASGGVVPIREGSEIKPIEAPTQPAFVSDHLDAAHRAIMEIGFTTTASWASSDAAATSGSESGMRLQPSVELARLKQVNLAWALAKVNEIILRIAERKISADDGLIYRGAIPLPNGRSEPFKLKLGGATGEGTIPDEFREVPDTSLPTAIGGSYETNVIFTDRLDMYDPQHSLQELSKYSQGAQSLRTTLENLGCQDPDNEIGLIVKEAEANPWMRQGMIALVLAQLKASEGQGGSGLPGSDAPMPGGIDPTGGLEALGAGLSQGGSRTDGVNRAVNGSADTGRPPGGVPGQIGGAY